MLHPQFAELAEVAEVKQGFGFPHLGPQSVSFFQGLDAAARGAVLRGGSSLTRDLLVPGK